MGDGWRIKETLLSSFIGDSSSSVVRFVKGPCICGDNKYESWVVTQMCHRCDGESKARMVHIQNETAVPAMPAASQTEWNLAIELLRATAENTADNVLGK